MPVSEFLSSNGILVKVSAEEKNQSGVFGRDFVTGGLRDYFSRSGSGFWIVAKCEVSQSNLDSLLREAVKDVMGSYPIVMPETHASHLVVALWEGHASKTSQEVLESVRKVVEQGQVTTKEKVVEPEAIAPRPSRAGRRVSPRMVDEDKDRIDEHPKELDERQVRAELRAAERQYNELKPYLGKSGEREWKEKIGALKSELKKVSVEAIVEGRGSKTPYLPSDLSRNEFDALQIVGKNGKEPVYDGGTEDFESLVRKGYLRKSGIRKKNYELTNKGRELIHY